MTRAYETSGGGRTPRMAPTLEYRHADEPGVWQPTSYHRASARLPRTAYRAIVGGSMEEHPSRDGLVVFRRRRDGE